MKPLIRLEERRPFRN